VRVSRGLVGFFEILGVGGLGGAERVDEVGDEIFLFGAGADGFFFVFYDDFVVGYLDDFAAGDDELGVDEGFEGGAPDDELLDDKILRGDGEIDDFAELGVFFGLDFEGEKVEVE